ncbi:MAG: glycosyltransferase family 4 protein [Candidatus Dormibacteraceae bacterium]
MAGPAHARVAAPAMSSLHVAIDGSGLARPLAGVGTYTREMLRAMALERPLNRMTVFLGQAASAPVDEAPIRYRPVPATRLLGRHLRWPAHIRRAGADCYWGPAGQLPLGRLGLPSVITVHDLAIYLEPGWFPARQPLSTRLVVPRSIRRASRIVAVSENTARDLSRIFGVEPGRMEVVPHGVGAAFRPLDPERQAAARARFQLPERFILFVGTIEPRKNLDTLLSAWAMMRDRPALVVAGGWGWRFEETRARIARLGDQVHLLGEVAAADLPLLYNLAACLAHPAWYEGFGLTALEAMACGVPVIASDRASLPEVVGDAGLLVPPDEPERWREALERVLREPEVASDLRRRGILRAAEFTWTTAAARVWRALERVTG